MSEIIVSIFILLGLLMMLAAAVGVLRLPDAYCRAHASGMSSTFGAMFFMVAALVYFTVQTGTFPFKLFLIALFIFLTGPIGSHMLTRAAYFTGIKPWEGTVVDDLKDYTPPKR